MKYVILSISILSLILVGCTPEPEVKPCTADWNPVCGTDGVTYGNACSAGDVEIAFEGECPEAHECTDEEKANQICTQEYVPVCGEDGNTYGNGCEACSAGVDSWLEGEC